MNNSTIEDIKTSIAEKKTTLTEWLETTPPDKKDRLLGSTQKEAVQSHLEVIDQTLEKCECNELGICEVCHTEIEPGLLEMDYTTCVCLGDMSEEESRHLEAELELAQTVQQSLMPQEVPDSPAMDISAFSRPAQFVGGDYFDFFQFQDGAEGLAIADVAGHGISASLYMAGLQALLRSLIPTSNSPADVISHVERLLIHNVRFSTFVTLFLASYDPDSHSLTYCNAGHNPPLVIHDQSHQGGKSTWLMPTGAAVGIVEGAVFEEGSFHLEAGDTMVLYTDGVTEATNKRDEEFGKERLEEVVRQSAGMTAKEIVQAIRLALANFTNDQNPSDDMTIVICKMAA
jgi:sigma-B regulation protein RsbU (phosphoserine phosphatase)